MQPHDGEPQAPLVIGPPQGLAAQSFSPRKLLSALRYFGPAAVVTSLSIGAGETILVTGLGAWAGYGLLWLLILSVACKGWGVTYLVGRYTSITGRTLGEQFLLLPGPRGWLLVAVLVAELLAMATGLTAVAKPCGNLLGHLSADWLLPDWAPTTRENLFTTVVVLTSLVLSLCTGYVALERQQLAICAVLVGGTLLALFMVGPDWFGVARGAVAVGTLPPVPTWGPPAARDDYVLNLFTVFGFVGGILSGYLAYAHWVRLHGWGLAADAAAEAARQAHSQDVRVTWLPNDPRQAANLRRRLEPLRWDVALGAIVLLIVTSVFMISGAAVLFPGEIALSGDGFQLLTQQATVWEQVHRGLVPIYYVAVLAALWGTLASVPEVITRVSHEFATLVWPSLARWPYRRWQYGVALWLGASMCFWTWRGVSFDRLTQVFAMITLNLGVTLTGTLALYFNWRLPALYRPRPLTRYLALAAIVVLWIATIGSAWGLGLKWTRS